MNETIIQQLNHRSIRKFTGQEISSDILDVLVDVARQTATSNFMQSYSIVSIKSPEKKKKLADICQQPYVGEASDIFIFIADQYRNKTIAEENNQETSVLQNMDRFMIAFTDAILTSQNVNIAAESLGLGTVFLGSILNDSRAIIDLLDLPAMTFPILGLAMGYPDQHPELKPRLPKELMFFEDTYNTEPLHCNELKEYDSIVSEYYDLRDTNKKVDSFTKQITDGMNRKPEKRLAILSEIKKQGFLKD
ncbi:MAG: NADPH-dependent oxidoreductase [Vagococcus sp.]